MTTTLNPTCPLCGLRFDSRPLLDLHIREDHRVRARRDPGDVLVPSPRPAGPSASPPGRPATRPRGVIQALRYVNDELMRAGEAIIRSARVPRPRRPDLASTAVNRDTTERVGRAA